MNRRTGTALLVLATCVGVQSAVAQVQAGQSRMSYGFVGGLNLANFTGSDVEGTDSRTAFYAGAALTMPLGGNLFLQPQALFSMQGAKDGDVTVKADYLQVPVFVGMRIPMQGSGIRPYVMAGPFVGFKLGCTWSGGGESGDCADEVGDIKSMDYGVAFGGGIELPMGSGTLQLGARFNLGLAKLIEDVEIKNSLISFGAGYFFGR